MQFVSRAKAHFCSPTEFRRSERRVTGLPARGYSYELHSFHCVTALNSRLPHSRVGRWLVRQFHDVVSSRGLSTSKPGLLMCKQNVRRYCLGGSSCPRGRMRPKKSFLLECDPMATDSSLDRRRDCEAAPCAARGFSNFSSERGEGSRQVSLQTTFLLPNLPFPFRSGV